MNFPFSKERAFFPILNKQVQLSSCSQSAMSVQVEQAIQAYLTTWREEGMNWTGWMEEVHAAKAAFAKIIGADVSEIAVLGSVSDIASAIASSLDFRGSRNKVVTTEMDFPCIGHVWLAQQKRGAVVDFIPSRDNTIPLEHIEAKLDQQTLMVSVPHVTYYNGLRLDLGKIADFTHQHGALLFVDAYQSAGNSHIDVKSMGIDILAAGSQKYLLGIPGISFLYIRKELAAQLEPQVTGWFGRENPFAFNIKSLDYAEATRRFETGTPPVLNAYAARAGFELLLSIGINEIEAYLRGLSQVAIEEAHRNGLTVASPLDLVHKAASTAIVVPNAMEAEQRMREKGFIVSARNDVIRIAPHFYNTSEEVALAIQQLAALVN